MRTTEIIAQLQKARQELRAGRYIGADRILDRVCQDLQSELIVGKIRTQEGSRKRAVKKLLSKVL